MSWDVFWAFYCSGGDVRGFFKVVSRLLMVLEIPILCASQTGTAFELAEFFAYEAGLHGISCRLWDIMEYPVGSLPTESMVVFFVSTTGQGEPPSNMKKFWHFLKIRDFPVDSLKDVRFALFGL